MKDKKDKIKTMLEEMIEESVNKKTYTDHEEAIKLGYVSALEEVLERINELV